MLMDGLKVLVFRNYFKKFFMGKEQKQLIVLTIFYISQKSDIKTFLK